ncbi:MAG TPA: hypothetical protein VHM89_13450 [Acidimicrobiales bacterium]|nr:hypothetical protein [Acidimicrobiales bacterium]
MTLRPRLVGALVGSLAAFAVAGAGFAGAQETPTTDPPAAESPSTTPAPDATAPDAAPAPDHCDHDGGSGTTSDAPAADNASVDL